VRNNTIEERYFDSGSWRREELKIATDEKDGEMRSGFLEVWVPAFFSFFSSAEQL